MDIARLGQKAFTRTHAAVYELTHGVIGHRIGRTEAVLLTTTGRSTGQRRVTPLTATPDGDRLLLIASNGGAQRDPDWYRNLLADPEVTVQRGKDKLEMIARTAGPDERPALWAKAVATYRGYDGYQRKTDREIPVVICEPR